MDVDVCVRGSVIISLETVRAAAFVSCRQRQMMVTTTSTMLFV